MKICLFHLFFLIIYNRGGGICGDRGHLAGEDTLVDDDCRWNVLRNVLAGGEVASGTEYNYKGGGVCPQRDGG